jgi:hypothetical protein
MIAPIYHRTGRSCTSQRLGASFGRLEEPKHVMRGHPPGVILTTWKLRRGANMSFDEALKVASRDERFMATIYAMNTLLTQKGIYTTEEFEPIFIEWVNKEQRRKARSVNASSQVLCEA